MCSERLVYPRRAAHVVTTSVVAGSTLRVEVETEDGRSRWCEEFAARCEHILLQQAGRQAEGKRRCALEFP